MKTRFITSALIHDGHGQFLICKMPINRGAYPGQWAIVGGGMEENETAEEALRREVKEEVGLEIEGIERFEFKDDIKEKMMKDGSIEEFYMVYLTYMCKAKHKNVYLGDDEFEEYQWVSLDEVLKFDLNRPTRETFKEVIQKQSSLTEKQLHSLWFNHPHGLIPKGTICPHCARYNARDVVGHALIVQDEKILMVLRDNEPMRGWWALPAGYIQWDESVEEGTLRELKEETNLDGKIKRLLGVYGDDTRDKDGRQNIAVVYTVGVTGEAKALEETQEVKWFNLHELPENIAFDHRQMIEDYKSRN